MVFVARAAPGLGAGRRRKPPTRPSGVPDLERGDSTKVITPRPSRLLIAAVLLVPLAVLHAADEAEKPNVLLIITDQQHAGMLSCTGNPRLTTPALDRIAARGMRFERAYCANPVCVPSRFSMFSGLMPSAIGLGGNGQIDKPLPEAVAHNTMGNIFRRAGYRTAYGGKVHLPGTGKAAVKEGRPGIANYGFDEYLTADERDGLSEACVRFLSEKHDRPFLLVASFINPHDICGIRNKVSSRTGMPPGLTMEEFIANHCPPLPANAAIPEHEPDLLDASLFKGAHAHRGETRRSFTDDDWRIYRWNYARLIEDVDRQIGLVMEALEQSGLADDTLVVFTSDHGDMDGAHRLGQKMMPYEEAIRVPFLIAGAGMPQGAVDREHLVSTGIDLIPTLCDCAGLETPRELPGRSVRPLVGGNAVAPWRDTLLVENGISQTILTMPFKYTLFREGTRREQLVDLEQDPGEMRNLAVDPAMQPQLRAARQQLKQSHALVGTQLPTRFSIPEDPSE